MSVSAMMFGWKIKMASERRGWEERKRERNEVQRRQIREEKRETEIETGKNKEEEPKTWRREE